MWDERRVRREFHPSTIRQAQLLASSRADDKPFRPKSFSLVYRNPQSIVKEFSKSNIKNMGLRYFLDSEFIENGITIELISIALVCSDGREYYAINRQVNIANASTWVRDNVFSQLPKFPWDSGFDKRNDNLFKCRNEIAEDILFFLSGSVLDANYDQSLNWEKAIKDIEFWANYAFYDWLVFCQLFGMMMDLPRGLPMYCHDLRQEIDRLKIPESELPIQTESLHHALHDARWNRDVYNAIFERAA